MGKRKTLVEYTYIHCFIHKHTRIHKKKLVHVFNLLWYNLFTVSGHLTHDVFQDVSNTDVICTYMNVIPIRVHAPVCSN